jgi:protoporphyrinogen oxidase
VTDFDFVVAGGGVTGLVAAHRLGKSGARVLLVEQSPLLGGLVATDIDDGFLIETGPDGFVHGKGSVLTLADEVGLEDEVIFIPIANRGWSVYADDGLQRVPEGVGLRFTDSGLVIDDTGLPGEFASFRTGMGRLVDGLAHSLADVEVITGVAVTRLAPSSGGWEVDLERGPSATAQGVVLAVPADTAAALVDSVTAGISMALKSVTRASSLSLNLAYHTEDLPDLEGTGFMVPRGLKRRISGVSFLSKKWEGRVPHPDFTLLRAFLTQPWPKDPVTVTRDELSLILGVTAPPVRAWARSVERGFHVYPPDHEEGIMVFEASLPPGLRVAGAGFHGVGLNECIDSGERAATALVGSTRPF